MFRPHATMQALDQKPNLIGDYYMNLNAIIKKQATALKTFLSEKNIDLPQTTCLHAIAVINGYKNWNTLNAVLSDQVELPNPNAQDTNEITLEDRLSDLEDMVHTISEDLDNLENRYAVREGWVDECLRGIDPNPQN